MLEVMGTSENMSWYGGVWFSFSQNDCLRLSMAIFIELDQLNPPVNPPVNNWPYLNVFGGLMTRLSLLNLSNMALYLRLKLIWLPMAEYETLCRFSKYGGGGIRTHGALADTLVFKTRALNHSTTPPGEIY